MGALQFRGMRRGTPSRRPAGGGSNQLEHLTKPSNKVIGEEIRLRCRDNSNKAGSTSSGANPFEGARTEEDKHEEGANNPLPSDSTVRQMPTQATLPGGQQDRTQNKRQHFQNKRQHFQNKQFLEHITPVGGRIRDFFQEWKKITTDKWIQNIIQYGYCIKLEKQPPNKRPSSKVHSAKELSLSLLEALELLNKEAIEIVPDKERNKGVYSNYFLVPKVDETLRLILDLRFLNKFIRTQRFKMTSLQEVIPQLQEGDYMATIDLKDAYLHIPINKRHK